MDDLLKVSFGYLGVYNGYILEVNCWLLFIVVKFLLVVIMIMC